MRRWLVQPVVWGVGLLVYWAGQLLDESIDLLNLTEDEECEYPEGCGAEPDYICGACK